MQTQLPLSICLSPAPAASTVPRLREAAVRALGRKCLGVQTDIRSLGAEKDSVGCGWEAAVRGGDCPVSGCETSGGGPGKGKSAGGWNQQLGGVWADSGVFQGRGTGLPQWPGPSCASYVSAAFLGGHLKRQQRVPTPGRCTTTLTSQVRI